MERKNKRILRIERYEEIYDKLSRSVCEAESALEALEALAPELAELEAYYTGPEWKKDFAADEAGRLPPELKRGVLSEDGVYGLLAEAARLRALNKD
jgi:hypothetical protein